MRSTARLKMKTTLGGLPAWRLSNLCCTTADSPLSVTQLGIILVAPACVLPCSDEENSFEQASAAGRQASITPISPVEEMIQQLQIKWQAAAEVDLIKLSSDLILNLAFQSFASCLIMACYSVDTAWEAQDTAVSMCMQTYLMHVTCTPCLPHAGQFGRQGIPAE